MQYMLGSSSHWAAAVKNVTGDYVPSKCCSLKLASIGSLGETRVGGYFIIEVALSLLGVKQSCLPFFLTKKGSLSRDYCGTLE